MHEIKFLPSFGRKRARGLSETQKNNLVNLYEIFGIEIPAEKISPQELFKENYEKIFFEIGFGHGEHLIQNAILNPDIGFIGCEPFENGVASILKEIQEKNLKNVRIYRGDARILLEKLKNNSINRFYILFPDPWRKKKHHKRRILSEEFLKNLQETQPGELVIATDHYDYLQSILENLRNLKIDHSEDLENLSKKPSWFLDTRYEQKAIAKGSKCYYLKLKI